MVQIDKQITWASTFALKIYSLMLTMGLSLSCLIYGKTKKGRDLHVQVSLPPVVVVITAYDPDPKEWIDFKIRR